MKKIVMGAAALLCAASMFAVDFAATIKMAGDIAGGAVTDKTDDATYIWKLNSNDQKDADALKLSVSGDQAGASFQFWYKYTGGAAPTAATTGALNDTKTALKTDDLKNDAGTVVATVNHYDTAITTNSMLQARSTSIWVKPIDQLKITIGDVSDVGLRNTLDYWKDPVGQTQAQASSWDLGYSNYATVEGAGILAELTPIDGLTVTAGIAAGCDTNFITFVENTSKATLKAYGASIKYNLSAAAGIPVNVAVAWRDGGTDAPKVLAVGADYGNAYADGFYGMINARMFFDYGVKTGGWYNYVFHNPNVANAEKVYKMTGIAFDNFFQYKAGAMTIALRAPFVLRGLAGKATQNWAGGNTVDMDASIDPSYMYWSLKFSYALDGLTVYVGAGSDYDDNLNAWVFNKEKPENTFNVTIHPGVTFNVGACAFDIGARFDIKDAELKTGSTTEYYRPFAWSIPFTATIGF